MIHVLYNGDPAHDDVIAHWFDASEEVAAQVLNTPVHDDGRSDFVWMRLSNGDLILGVFPCGETYFDIEESVAADYKKAEKTDD